jgi:hypothetical protein
LVYHYASKAAFFDIKFLLSKIFLKEQSDHYSTAKKPANFQPKANVFDVFFLRQKLLKRLFWILDGSWLSDSFRYLNTAII